MSKSNQQATVNRQKVLHCTMAARREADKLRRFNRVCRTDAEIVQRLANVENEYDQIVRRIVELSASGELIEGRD